MTLSELTIIIKRIIHDPNAQEAITDMLNQGVLEISGGMKSSLGDWITPPLPELLTISTVMTTTDPYVTLSTDDTFTFQRNLKFVVSSTGNEIDLAESFLRFIEVYPALSQVGMITSVIEQGGMLYYQGIPSTPEELTIYFYRYPIDMEDDDDEPDGIPKHLQSGLLVNYVAWKLYELIEEGLDGKYDNTVKYQALFFEALKTLELTIPYETRKIEFKNTTIN